MNVADIAKRSFKEALADNISGEGAKAAYYFFLSFFPLILAAFALAGYLGDSAFETIRSWITRSVPHDAGTILSSVIDEITKDRKPGALTFGVVLTIWSASNFFSAIADGLDAMFDVQPGSWWKKRIKAITMMFTGGVVLLAGGVLIVAGPGLFARLGLGFIMTILRWPIVFALLTSLFWLLYYILPDRHQGAIRKELLTGAAVGAAIWMIATAGFRVYVSRMGHYGAAYGSLGGVIVLLLWLYLTAIAILFGGEVADVLAKHGSDKLAGQRDDPGSKEKEMKNSPPASLPPAAPRTPMHPEAAGATGRATDLEQQVERRVREVEAHVRARPLATVGLALIAGFVTGRILRD